MEPLTTAELARACRTFMDLAYPSGAETMPAHKRPYFEIADDDRVEEFLPPAPAAARVCQDLSQLRGGLRGFEFRLGSASYPHLKLRIQQIDLHGRDVWVYSVDTHDGFKQATKYLTPEETGAWQTMVDQNRLLKNRIEDELALAGFLTPKGLLQSSLPTAAKPVG